MLTEEDWKRLWELFADALSEKHMDSDPHRGIFNENVIPTADYETNRKVVIDLAKQILIDYEIDTGPRVFKIAPLPPPKPRESQSDGRPSLQRSLQVSRSELSLGERLYDYIIERKGEISQTRASQDLGVTLEEISEALEQLVKSGKLSPSSVESTIQIEEQTQLCRFCQQRIPSDATFCIHCGQSQSQETRIEFEPRPRSDSTNYEWQPPIEQKKRTEVPKRETERSRYTLSPDKTARSRNSPFLARILERRHEAGGRVRPPPLTSGKPSLRPIGRSPAMPPRPIGCRTCGHILEFRANRWYCTHCRRYQ
jgi:DNA-binding transcriptional MerR regulator